MPIPSESPLNRCPPQLTQKDFGCPSGGRHVWIMSAPSRISKASALTLAFSVEVVPLRRWHRLLAVPGGLKWRGDLEADRAA
jgi:hypothetical protein